jgi:hypothetical protein
MLKEVFVECSSFELSTKEIKGQMRRGD